MSSRASAIPERTYGSVQSFQSSHSPRDGPGRRRAASRAYAVPVTHDDAYTFALRIAFLNYVLQPRKKRKEYVPVPQKPLPRVQTSAAALRDFLPTGMASSNTMKLPPGFRGHLENRMRSVIKRTEKLGGFNDPPLIQSFAEAFVAFTEQNFQKQLDHDRKVEPLILIFSSAATKAQIKTKAPDDDSYKQLADRHLAMFVRLLVAILKELPGVERERPELLSRLKKLEEGLLRNDQDLTLQGSQGKDNQYVEVEVPLTYEVKDMHMVQVVIKIFGLTISQVQQDIDTNLTSWSEEAALKDYKAYQFRLSSEMAGTLNRHDFDVDEAFEEWRKGEASHLGQIFAEILSVRPRLRGHLSSSDKALPFRPQSLYGEDKYAELSKMLSNSDTNFDQLSLGSLALDDTTSVRSVDEPNYTFIPPDPRAFYKTILEYTMSYDQLHSDPNAEYTPFSHESIQLLHELSVRWRIPQFSRLVSFVEVAAQKFLDQELDAMQLHTCLEYVKEPQPAVKKAPLIQLYPATLPEIDPSRWTIHDYAVYKQTLEDLNDALLRDLYSIMIRCYEPKPPTIGVVMAVLMDHIHGDDAFSQRPEEAAEFSQHLEHGLRASAATVYRDLLDSNIPSSQNDWNFAHVVDLGKGVVALCERIKKRYRKNPEVLGVSPYKVLVETMFPSFEGDAHEFIKRVLAVAREANIEVNVGDGLDLYRELVAIRKIHVECLPDQPFAFHIEGLLEEFVWRVLKVAEETIESHVEEAIRHDQFKVRPQNPDQPPTDDERHSLSIIDIFQMFRQYVNQIWQLEWDDDVHHARFMTALARAFTAGIGRYCEIVEQQFTKEMDRQTPQEVAAITQTTQERLMQYAKEAWNTKDKVEPFQFYSEVSSVRHAMCPPCANCSSHLSN